MTSCPTPPGALGPGSLGTRLAHGGPGTCNPSTSGTCSAKREVPREPILRSEKWRRKKFSALCADWSALHTSIHCLRQRLIYGGPPPFINPVSAPVTVAVMCTSICFKSAIISVLIARSHSGDNHKLYDCKCSLHVLHAHAYALRSGSPSNVSNWHYHFCTCMCDGPHGLSILIKSLVCSCVSHSVDQAISWDSCFHSEYKSYARLRDPRTVGVARQFVQPQQKLI